MDFLQRFLDVIADAIDGVLDTCRNVLDFIIRLFQTLLVGLRRIVAQCARLIFYAGPFAGLLFAGLDLRSQILFWIGVVTLALPFVSVGASILGKIIAVFTGKSGAPVVPRRIGDEDTLFRVTLVLNLLTLLFFADWYFQGGYGIALWNQLWSAIVRLLPR